MYTQSVPVFVRMLTNLSGILDKAAQYCAERKIDPAVLLGSRLFPDMFTFTRQVQIASDTAKGASARLAGVEVPKFEDNEASIDELKARIAKTIAFVQSLPEAQFAGSDTRSVTIPMRGEQLSIVGLKYLNNNVLPNFYFHLATAYGILRHNGVPLGKADFTGPIAN
jgi:hypothetical protein